MGHIAIFTRIKKIPKFNYMYNHMVLKISKSLTLAKNAFIKNRQKRVKPVQG